MNKLLSYFQRYTLEQAPFMHQQYQEWRERRPLDGYTVAHNVPLVTNTLLKIACLVAAGAEVIVTNPNFLPPDQEAIAALREDGIEYVAEIQALRGRDIDIYFDCGGELYQKLGAPGLGAVEITASGDAYYRQAQPDFPVISIDPTYTKQLETVFGSAESANTAISHLTGATIANKSWMIFGFGKIGRGLAYYCVKEHSPAIIADINNEALNAARALGLTAIEANDAAKLQHALQQSDIVITATGKANSLEHYPREWFKGKILANMGIFDEFGPGFDKDDVLNHKLPVNFILKDPTPMRYIDPEFYAHNIAVTQLFEVGIKPGVYALDSSIDAMIMDKWCAYHDVHRDEINAWFLAPK